MSDTAPVSGQHLRLRRLLGFGAGAAVGSTAGLLFALLISTQVFGFRVLAVQSGSMEPAILSGDFVVARPVTPADVSRGDVIVFEAEQGIAIAHRVVRVVRVVFDLEDSSSGEVTTQSVEYRFTTRGDANPVDDSNFVTGDRVAGEVWFTIPGFGLGATSFPIQLALLGLAAVFGVAWLLWELHARRTAKAQ